MQQIATKVFIVASVIFGVVGIAAILTSPGEGSNIPQSAFNIVLTKIVMVMVFIILPSFALSIAGRYLSSSK